jgi:hypothetical protein
MSPKISICGLDCASCGAFIATQADDIQAKEKVAAEWRAMYNAPGIVLNYVTCDGCLSNSGRLGGHCSECDIRACGMEHHVENCASCPEYACERITAFFAMAPEARQVLDALRK